MRNVRAALKYLSEFRPRDRAVHEVHCNCNDQIDQDIDALKNACLLSTGGYIAIFYRSCGNPERKPSECMFKLFSRILERHHGKKFMIPLFHAIMEAPGLAKEFDCLLRDESGCQGLRRFMHKDYSWFKRFLLSAAKKTEAERGQSFRSLVLHLGKQEVPDSP